MKYEFLRFPEGRAKAVSFSYDDGSIHDVRFTETLNRYGIKCTYNLIGERVAIEKGLTRDFIRNEILAKGHEIADHGYEHAALDAKNPLDTLDEILKCRLYLEQEFGCLVRGMGFPDRSVNRFHTPLTYARIRQALIDCGIVYARVTGMDNDSFALPEDWFNWGVTARHSNPAVFDYIDRFLSLNENELYCASRSPKHFFLCGHAHEFERDGNWDRLEEICRRLGEHEDVWYATCIEVYEYVNAFRALERSADGRRIYNPTLLDVWFDVDGVSHCVKSGQTISL